MVNGVKQFVSIQEWANETLSAEDLALFNAAKAREDALWETEKASGNVTVTNLDSDGNPIVNAPPPPTFANTWPQVMSISINGSPPKTGLFNADFTSNLPPLSPTEKAGTHTIINHSAGSTYQKFFDANGNFISMTTPMLINIVSTPVTAMGIYTWHQGTFQPDPEFIKFSEQYRTDPSLTWDGDSEQFYEGQ